MTFETTGYERRDAADPIAVATDAAIAARSLRRTFKGGIEAVRDIDLTVSAGEVFGFLGPNGAGKTTTVRMLCTLLPPTAGTATVAGLDVVENGAAVRRRIGVALQEIGLDPVQTGRELLELQCGLYGITGQAGRSRTEELLVLVGLSEAADRRTKTYSGGMKRRLDLASALVHSPEVLFLDEPTTGLDPASRLAIWAEVRRINAGGATVFLTTQYLEEADQLCDRLAIIDDGQIVAEGTPAQLKAEMGHDVVSLTVEGANVAAQKPRCPDCPASSASWRCPTVWRCTSRTAPARSPRSCADSSATRFARARSRSPAPRSTTCS